MCYKLRFIKYALCNMFIFWVIPRRHKANSRRFGTLYQFHLHRQVDEVLYIEAHYIPTECKIK